MKTEFVLTVRGFHTVNPVGKGSLICASALDRFGRITDHAWKKGTADVVRIQHAYDRAGNRLNRNDVLATSHGLSETYQYDGLNQLTSLARPNGSTEKFTYDATGNCVEYSNNGNVQTRTHNAANEILSIDNAKPIDNDKNGNMLRIPKPLNLNESFSLVYDAWNRLVAVKDNAAYTYDALNRRVKKTVNGETRVFYYNRNWQCLEEHVAAAIDITYVWGMRYVDDLVRYVKGSETLYAIQDANWNVIALANTSGTALERYNYSAFGRRNVYSPDFTPRATSLYPTFTRTFTGQVLDAETGLMLYRNRFYHPNLGQFIQRDPIGYIAGDKNLYRYVVNSPTIYADIYGQSLFSWLFSPPPPELMATEICKKA